MCVLAKFLPHHCSFFTLNIMIKYDELRRLFKLYNISHKICSNKGHN